MVHSLKSVKYIIQPVLKTDIINEFKYNIKIWHLQQICNNFLDYFQNNNIQSAITELEEILKKYSNDTFIFESLVKVWHNFYNYLTCSQDNALFNPPLNLIKELTSKIEENNKSDCKTLILTMTTCKRMTLTYRTINSLLYCMTDLGLWCSKFIVVDDNSSEEDRLLLLKTYPFITLIRKDESQKGHPKSMNIILNEIKDYKYQFHLEDDWEFFYPDNYITKCIQVLDANKEYGQCLINRDYGEDPVSINRIGGSIMKSLEKEKYKEKLVYYEHQQFTGEKLQIEQKKSTVSNQYYWPHFSFRVGVTKVEIYNKIGMFDESAKHFEMEYGFRYVHAGYKTASLDRVYCTHIGRRTYERNSNKKNAYDLNNEIQFGEEKKNDLDELMGGLKERDNHLKPVKFKIYVVNLKRRKDRLLQFIKNNINECQSFSIYEAIDGSKIIPNSKVQRLFETGDYNYRRGIVGVASSMIDIWKEFLTDSFSDYAIILEDDIKLVNGFIRNVIHYINTYKDKFDIIFGHMNPYNQQSINPNFFNQNITPNLIQYSTERMMKENMGSMAATILTKNGARILLEEINNKGVYNAIDWVAMKTCDKQRAFVCEPFLGFTEAFQNNIQKDTDIQKDFSNCSLVNWFEHEINYWINQLKGSKKNKSNIRIVSTNNNNSKEELYQTITKLNFNIYNLKLSEVKQNDILINFILDEINEPLQHITICKKDVKVNCKVLKYYRTNVATFIIPFNFINEEVDKSKTWGDGYLNLVHPI